MLGKSKLINKRQVELFQQFHMGELHPAQMADLKENEGECFHAVSCKAMLVVFFLLLLLLKTQKVL